MPARDCRVAKLSAADLICDALIESVPEAVATGSYARRAVGIYQRLGQPNLLYARQTLADVRAPKEVPIEESQGARQLYGARTSLPA